MNELKNAEHEWWRPVLELVVHVLVGSLLFAVVFSPAVGLDLLIQWLRDEVKISEGLILLLTTVKYAVGVIDAILYLGFLLKMGWTFSMKLWQS